MKSIVVIAFCLLRVYISSAQLSTKETGDLQTVFHTFFYNSEIAARNSNRNSGNSELFIYLLKTDEAGKIISMKLFSEVYKFDSGFAVLSKLSPKDFSGWQSLTNKNKTIVMPIVVLNNSAQTKEWVVFLDNFKKLGRSPGLISAEGMAFYWPIIMD